MKTYILRYTYAAIVALVIALFALPQRARAQEKEAYVVKNYEGTTLTFYYDTQKEERPGTKWGIDEKHEGTSYPIWASTPNNLNKTITQAVFDVSFKDFRPTTTAKWFCILEALKQITGIENLNTSEVTDMSYMFTYCEALTELDVSKFDTKNVTNMNEMFYYCKSLTQLDVSNFDTKNVTNMNEMFENCRSLTQLNVSNFNTGKVTGMRDMFNNCVSLRQLDVSNFDTKNVTDMSYMFYGCTLLPKLDVNKFNTENVLNMASMFCGCTALTRIYCDNTWTCGLSEEMFYGCVTLEGVVSYDENRIDVTMANPNTGYFTNMPPTSISQTGRATTVKAVYSVDGRRQKETRPGVNIVKMSDGTTRKIIKK